MAPKRSNGFMRPFAGLQIATWVWFPVLLLQFLLFVSPILPVAASITCTLVFFACAFAAVYYGYVATVTDPMDVHLAKHLSETVPSSHRAPEGFQKLFYRAPTATPPEVEEPMKYCWVCEISVAQHSMHCKYCNKCVAHFDHHCQWLNTCVGQANYDYFFKTLCSICAMLFVHTFVMVGLVIDIFVGGTTRQRADDWFNAGLWQVVAGVNIFFVVANLVSLSLVAQLLAFHIALQRKNMSTYEFILSDSAAKREAFQKREERRTKRVVAVAKAKQEGEPVLACRLQLGKYCATCDPLADEESPTESNGAFGSDDQLPGGYAELSNGDSMLSNGGSMDQGNMAEGNESPLVAANGASPEEEASSSEVDGVEVQQEELHVGEPIVEDNKREDLDPVEKGPPSQEEEGGQELALDKV